MHDILSAAAFVISDMLLLINVTVICGSDFPDGFKLKPYKPIIVSICHTGFTLLFNSYYSSAEKPVMAVMLVGYYLRFIASPFLFTYRIKFISLYAPLLLISLDSLTQSCVLWVSEIFSRRAGNYNIKDRFGAVSILCFFISIFCAEKIPF